MKAIILAAGMSRRFGEFLGGKPKCLLEVNGRPLLQRQVQLLRKCGIKELVIVRGYNAEAIEVEGARYFFNSAFETTNMVHSLFCAEEALSGDVLLAYADLLYDFESLSRIVNASAAPVSVAADMQWDAYYRARYDDPFIEAESLVLKADCRIEEIGEANPPRHKIQAQYVGLIRLNSEGSKLFRSYYHKFEMQFKNREWLRKRQFEKAHMTDFLQGLINEGVRVQAVPINGGWLEFDSPSDYQRVQSWIATGTLDQFCRLE